MWYRNKVGQEVTYLYSLHDCHMGREDCGLANIVMKEDCEIIIKNNKMKAIYKFNFDCGRQGSLDGVFVANRSDVSYLVENKIPISFGEVLGKHSNVTGYVDKSEIIEVTDDVKMIELFESFDLSSGYSPFDYPVDFWENEEWLSKDDIAKRDDGFFDDFCFIDWMEYKNNNK